MRTVVSVVGTRPEAVKVAPLVLELRKHPGRIRSLVLATAQHREMLDQALAVFGIAPDRDLDVMTAGQSLTEVTCRVLEGAGRLLDEVRPDLLVVQGDTTTTFAAALAAFYRKVPVAHLEAGLRTFERYSPFPEELNRSMTTRLASLHFAPSAGARANLLAEGVDERAVVVTGNTVIDALEMMVEEGFDLGPELEGRLAGKRLVVLTAHRRESFGAPIREALAAVAELVRRHADLAVVYPVHPNPNVKGLAEELLGGEDRVHLVPPLGYRPFCNLMARATLLLTDSGGLQEEGPHLGKPVLVLRAETERPEAVEAGTVRLVGCDRGRILAEASRLLDDPVAYAEMAQARNPYGDGTAARRSVEAIMAFLA